MRNYLIAALLGGMFAICAEHFFTIDDALNKIGQNQFVATVEAQSSQRFRFEAAEGWTENGKTTTFNVSYRVAAICDTANGNLIYISGASQSSPAVVPNGCEKSPR